MGGGFGWLGLWLGGGRAGFGRVGGCMFGASQVVELAAGFVGLPAEADGAAAEADLPVQRLVRGRRLGERVEGLKGEADDRGGEVDFFCGFSAVVGEHGMRRLPGGGGVVAGGGEEVYRELGQNGVQRGEGGGGHERLLPVQWSEHYRNFGG